MKQQCPKCENWVEGREKEEFKRDLTSGMIKAGASGLAAGLFNAIIPGSGFIAGALAKNASNKLTGQVNDMLYGDISYEFVCFNCGQSWVDLVSHGTNNQLAKDELVFQQSWEYFLENGEEILSSTENVDGFLLKYETNNIVNQTIKSKMDFLLAFCAYCAVEADNRYLAISQKYLNRALRSNNDKEYQLFAELLNNKVENRNTKSIVQNAIKLLGELKEDQMFFKQEWYVEQLQEAIEKETRKYKETEIQKAKSTFIMNSIFCVPILLFVIYKYAMYEVSDGFWSAIFSWLWVYWLLLLTIGGIYLVAILAFLPVLSRKDEEWRELLVKQYTGFNWSDLLK